MYLQKINLKNKYALVTGAGKGLGRACSIALAETGATVIALSRTSSDLNKLEKDIKKVKGKIIKVSCDVMNYEDLKQKLDKIKIIDIWFGFINCTYGFCCNINFKLDKKIQMDSLGWFISYSDCCY